MQMKTWQWIAVGVLLMVMPIISALIFTRIDPVDNESLDEQYAFCDVFEGAADRLACQIDVQESVFATYDWWNDVIVIVWGGAAAFFIAGFIVMLLNLRKLIHQRA